MLETALFWNVFSFLITIFEFVPFKIILDESSELKDNVYVSNKLILYLSLTLIIIISTLLTIFNLNIYIKLFLNIAIMFLFSKINYKVNTVKAIYFAAVYNLMLVCLEIISIGLIMLVNSSNYIKEALSHNYVEFEVSIISKFSILLVIPIVKGINIKKMRFKKEYIFLIFPIVINLIIILVIFKIMSVLKLDKESVIVFISLSVLIVTNVICLVKVFKLNELKLFNKLILEKMNILKKHYFYLKDPDYNVSLDFKTGDLVVDAILTEKNCICKSKNISLLIDIDVSKFKFIDYNDLSSLFYNLLDNSIELCETTKSKEKPRIIRITGGQKRKNIYVLKCETTKVFEFVEENELVTCIKSNTDIDKKGSLFDNTYLDSIKKILEPFGADVQVKTSCDKVYINIIFYLDEKQILKLDENAI